MARITPCVKDGSLVFFEDSIPHMIAVDSETWWDWLAGETELFRVEFAGAACSVRREVGRRWCARKVVNGKTRRVYLGASASVTLAALHEAAHTLSERDPAPVCEEVVVMPDVSLLLMLTPRQREVLGCLCFDLTNKQSAAQLGISPHTVRSHIRRIYNKLNLFTRPHVVVFAKTHYETLFAVGTV